MRRQIFMWTLLVTLVVGTGFAGAFELLDPREVDVLELGDSIGQYGGALSIHAGASGPKTLNPHRAAETSSTDVTSHIFEGLVALHRDTGEVLPQLAREYEISEDGTEVLFKLRRGVKWHDGVEFTADDVIFTFDVVYDPDVGSNSRAGLLIDGQPMEYEKIDKYTVKFTLPRPHAPIMYSIGTDIVPVHLLGEAHKEGRYHEMWGIDTPVDEIVGTGAWRLGSYRIDQELILVKFDDYYEFDNEGNRLPYVSRIIYRYYPDSDSANLAFFHGEFDYKGIPADAYPEFVDREPVSPWSIVDSGPDPGTSFIVLNQNPGFVPEPKLSWFTDVKFRQALYHAVDKETILDMAMNGRGFIQESPINMRNEFFLKEDLVTYPYDLEVAHEKLEAAGYKLGADGVRRDQDGNAIEFDLITNPGVPIRQIVGELFQEDLGELGIKVNFQMIDFNVVVEKLTDTFEWDGIIIGLTGTFDPNGGSNVWLSSGNLHMWHPFQETPATEWEAKVDELWFAQQRAMVPEDRRDIFFEYQDIVAENVPLFYTVNSMTSIAIRDHLRNARPDIVGGGLGSAWNFIWLDR
ncbi:MAG: ABC transporter substrate-binding protein [Firmicutes bacterium]|nr:ABC transporter substrate-binding protein [Bacillota bacterium]